MKRITLLFFILVNCVDAISCSCYRKGIVTVKDYNSSDLIFIGTLIRESILDTDAHNDRRVTLYKIIKAYKGTSVGDTVGVYDSQYIGACGLGRLNIGRDYLIYAIGNEKKYTSACSRTTLVPAQLWPRDSAFINKLKKLISFGRVYDTLYTNFHSDTTFLNKHVSKISNNTFQEFYDEQGKISAKGRYRNGLPEGLWSYFEDGSVVYNGKYLRGKKDSLWVESSYSNDSSVYIREYKNGEFTYREKSFDHGVLYSEIGPIDDGKKWIDCKYHSNAKPRFIAYANPPVRNEKGELQEATWDGPFKMFNKAGIVLEAGMNKDGSQIGHWKNYYEDGKLRMEGYYVGGEKSGIWKIYYPNTQVKAFGEYKNNEKIGTWKYYDEKGKEVSPDPKLLEEDEDWFTYSGEKN